jgi:16S rRNA (guanine527-N7)-methyltransferase
LNFDLIESHFPSLTAGQLDQFRQLGILYPEWNAKINVISRQDIDNLYERHVLHSLGIAKVINFKSGTRILDAGTGGGFPGIPLAILFPEVHFHLVDSTAKKLGVVRQIAEATRLENISTEHCRLEAHSGRYDFVVSRAVATLDQMAGWVFKNIKQAGFNDIPNGILYLKGGELEGELRSLEAWRQGGMEAWRQGGMEKYGAGKQFNSLTIEQLNNRTIKHQIYPLSRYFPEPFFGTKSLVHLFY